MPGSEVPNAFAGDRAFVLLQVDGQLRDVLKESSGETDEELIAWYRDEVRHYAEMMPELGVVIPKEVRIVASLQGVSEAAAKKLSDAKLAIATMTGASKKALLQFLVPGTN